MAGIAHAPISNNEHRTNCEFLRAFHLICQLIGVVHANKILVTPTREACRCELSRRLRGVARVAATALSTRNLRAMLFTICVSVLFSRPQNMISCQVDIRRPPICRYKKKKKVQRHSRYIATTNEPFEKENIIPVVYNSIVPLWKVTCNLSEGWNHCTMAEQLTPRSAQVSLDQMATKLAFLCFVSPYVGS